MKIGDRIVVIDNLGVDTTDYTGKKGTLVGDDGYEFVVHLDSNPQELVFIRGEIAPCIQVGDTVMIINEGSTWCGEEGVIIQAQWDGWDYCIQFYSGATCGFDSEEIQSLKEND